MIPWSSNLILPCFLFSCLALSEQPLACVTFMANCACSLWRAFVACAARSHRPCIPVWFLRPARLSTALFRSCSVMGGCLCLDYCCVLVAGIFVVELLWLESFRAFAFLDRFKFLARFRYILCTCIEGEATTTMSLILRSDYFNCFCLLWAATTMKLIRRGVKEYNGSSSWITCMYCLCMCIQ